MSNVFTCINYILIYKPNVTRRMCRNSGPKILTFDKYLMFIQNVPRLKLMYYCAIKYCDSL